ncbi:hypothetical protein K3N28_01020 [Glycomyces sp. TRM65418]|uniref:hypothetical protein n=1 Tax=Glycomyces sp. TRM65418 TaxID=2867006 RepID=UPI001CE5ABA9|nr:hypothetical protein [Glycomyces sp. TRM65418]MCC3761655.1 hypothetical protein [Glycomyces sp. TRM65418]QZD55749.1 hypothetical protein K3N28_01010 [Glycomyces sp. TRM65418]
MSATTAQHEFAKIRPHLDTPTAPSTPVGPTLHDVEIPSSAPETLLADIAAALNGKAPHALIDCADFTVDELPELLATAKTGLERPCEHYPRLWFRRLEVGFAVIAERIDNTYGLAYSRAFRTAARQTIAPPLLTQQKKEGIVALLAQIGPRVALAGAFAVSVMQRRYPSLYDFYKWWGHRDRPGDVTVPEARLSELNHHAHPPGANATPNRRERDRLLIEAMLADLRHAYGRGRLAKHQWYRSVILLRHSHARTGSILRERLRSVLAELAAEGLAPPPLLVIGDGLRPPSESVEGSRT